MNPVRGAFMKRLLLLFGLSFCVLLSLDVCFMKHLISPREFGVLALVWWVVLGALLTVAFRSTRKAAVERRATLEPQERKQEDRELCLRGIRSCKRSVTFWVLALCLGLLASTDAPLLPRLAGISINLTINGLLIYKWIQFKNRLKHI
jgi:hypothetical protein